MQTIHIKNLEKYHPGYKDRELIWCKTYFKMVNADPEFEMLCEIDRWRFVALVMLELQVKKPIPLNNEYLKRKGFDLRKRPISLTVQMLHNLVEVCNGGVTKNPENVTQSRVEKSRVEKSYSAYFEKFWKAFKGRWNEEKHRYFKGGKMEAFEEWNKLTDQQRELALKAAPLTGSKITKDACRWLKYHRWEDFEIPEQKAEAEQQALKKTEQSILAKDGPTFRKLSTEKLEEMLKDKYYIPRHWLIGEILKERKQ